MSLNARVQELKKKHANLSATVEEQQRSPAVDPLILRDMKKEKLRLKEEISRLDR